MSKEILIKVSNFTKSFGSKTVHRGVSFDVHKGETIGLIGGSGVGKSVILRSLIGLEKPDQGHIEILGQKVDSFTEEDWMPLRKRIAYCFQNGALFDSMSVFENLAYPLREHLQLKENEIEEKVFSTLERFGLKDSYKLYPASLSGGMQKRLGVARAIVLGPEIILYDEPTSGLDPSNTRKIERMMLELKASGVGSILVTHDMSSAFRVCDRILILSDGKLFDGSHTELIDRFVKGEIQ